MIPIAFLHSELSRGPREGKRGEFSDYSQADMDVKFIMALISENEDVASNVCIPKILACYFNDANGDVTVRGAYNKCKMHSDKLPAGVIVIGAMTNAPKLLYPRQLKHKVHRCLQQKSFIIFNFGIYPQHAYSQGHANGLMINKSTNTVERWESHGLSELETYHENIQNVFELDPWFQSFDYVQIISMIGPQDRVDAFDGLCVTYSTMFVIVRLTNPSASPLDIYDSISKLEDDTLLRYVLRFNKFMIETLRKYPKHTLFRSMIKTATISTNELKNLRSQIKRKATPLGTLLKNSIRVTGKSVVQTTANYLYDSLKHILEHPNYKQWWRYSARESFKSLDFLNEIMSPLTTRKKQRFFDMLL